MGTITGLMLESWTKEKEELQRELGSISGAPPAAPGPGKAKGQAELAHDLQRDSTRVKGLDGRVADLRAGLATLRQKLQAREGQLDEVEEFFPSECDCIF